MKRQNKGGGALLLLLGLGSWIAGCSVDSGGRPDVDGPGLEPAAAKTPAAPPATPATPAKPPEHCKNVPAYPDISGSLNGASVVGSTVGATNAFKASCAAELSGDVAYVVRPKKSGPITATTDTAGTNFDTVVSVHALCNDPLVEVACNDDSNAGFQSTVTWDATAGAAYLVVVSGFWDHEGAFQLALKQVEGKPGAQPANPASPSNPATPGGPGGPALPPVFCQHSECAAGAPLKDGCSACVTKVCDVDAYCCDVAWDGLCVNEAGLFCGNSCPPPPPPPPPPPATCGDGVCSWAPGDDCLTCPMDCKCPPPPGLCGDGVCSGAPGDDCWTCSQDCGACPSPECGNFMCEPGEDCSTCPTDCWCPPPPVCGDGLCSWMPGDDCTCPSDCGICPPPPVCGNAICDKGEDCWGCPSDCTCPPPPLCGDGICSWMPGDDCWTCPGDCYCPPPPVCGDGICTFTMGDDCWTCPTDCGACPPAPTCGDGVCDPAGEFCGSCPQDCGECPPPPVCGDGICQETCFACPLDCACPSPVCGDGTCGQGENCVTCQGDCGACQACSHDECTVGPALGYKCSPCVMSVCDVDAYCCSGTWDGICVTEMQSICGTTCSP